MRTLFVYPEFDERNHWDFKDALRFIRKKSSMPSLGLATVTAMLPREQFEVELVDMNVGLLTDEQIRRSDIVLVSSMVAQKKAKIIERAHKLGKKVAAGGPHPTSYFDEVDADYIVAGEAEITLKPFLEDLLNGKARHFYDEGSCLKRQPSLPVSKNGKPLLTSTPIPRWDLLDLKNYASLPVQFSRGCPYDCEFCDITTLYGRVPRTKIPEQIIDELNAIHERGWEGSVFFVDDNFTGNKKKVRELLPVLIDWQEKRGYPFLFFTEASLDLALLENKDILYGMNRAGFDSVFVGIESPNTKALEGMNKKQNLGSMSLEERVEVIQRAGFEVTSGFIIGNDEDTPDVFENIYNFVQKTGIVVPMIGLLTAVRGTRLYERLKREGRLRSETPSGSNTHDFSFNFTPKLDEKFLIEGYADLLKKVFNPKAYFKRCETLEQTRGKRHRQKLANSDGFYALGKIVYENSIVRPDFQFFKYVFGTLLRNPSNFPEAISRSVKLYHFRTMTDSAVSVLDYQKEITNLYERFCERANKLRDRAGESVHEFKDEIAKIEDDVIRKATRKYDTLHEDFRRNASGALENLKEMIGKYKTEYFAGLRGVGA